MLRPVQGSVRVRRRLPAFWRGVDDGLGTGDDHTGAERSGNVRGDGHGARSERLRLWKLICTALRIPSRQVGGRLMVPAMYETMARKHLAAVAREGRVPPPPPPPVRHNIPFALLALAGLIVWFAITRELSLTGISAFRWNDLGALDVWQTLQGQWYRVFTALTLHSGSDHLLGNVLFGSPFFVLLCRRVGTGPGMALAVLSGGLGNLGNALYRLYAHTPTFVSLGFSTALFGIVGALSGIMAMGEVVHALRIRHAASPRQLFLGLRRALVLMAAGVAVLAMLGSDPSARTDYAAHVFGLLAGLVCGGSYALILAHRPLPAKAEHALGAAAVGVLAVSWYCALR